MTYPPDVRTPVEAVARYLGSSDPGGLVGVYLTGSAASTGLRPDSDVDLLVVTERSLSASDRRALVRELLGVSGWRGHSERFPEVAGRRPVELTGLTGDDLRLAASEAAVETPPCCDFQFGEWLREGLVNGDLPSRTPDPDAVVLVASAREANKVLLGPPLESLVGPVPVSVLQHAVTMSVPQVLEGVAGDERNVLLTLARILVTLDTGRIVSKDEAADAVIPTLAGEDRQLMERARDGYLGHVSDRWADDWADQAAATHRLAHALASRTAAPGVQTSGASPS